MEYLTSLVAMVRSRPVLGVAIVVGLVAGYLLLQRKSRMQREADERLSALRRDKADKYTKLRSPH
jgi:phosphoribosylcarboxyaminoimidazole (NCAIR) mutase